MSLTLSDKCGLQAGAAGGWRPSRLVWIRYNNSKNAELFVFATNDNYVTTQCWNLDCAFVLYPNSGVTLGQTWSVYATDGGSQYYNTFKIWKTSTSPWVFVLGNSSVGYWDASFFKSDNSGVRAGATVAQVGGEVYGTNSGTNAHTTTDMGTGSIASNQYPHAGFAAQLQYQTSSYAWSAMPDNAGGATDSACYSRVTADGDPGWGNYVFFGGPGRNLYCP